MNSRRLIVTHHAPDLDAITSVWLLKRFDSQRYADAYVAFVNPGDLLSDTARTHYGVNSQEVIHVDTGQGEFDHHQPERALQQLSATALIYDHVCGVHPDLSQDEALRTIVTFATQIDHFGEIHWPDSANTRYSFMIHELIRGGEFTHPHDDESQLHFGMQCLDSAYAVLTQKLKAEEIIAQKGIEFQIAQGSCLAIETRNDDTLKEAQKKGFILVVRKDSEAGHIRIKVRPDADLMLDALHDRIKRVDQIGTWYYHGSGKMLINGSRKHQNQTASPLSLEKVINLIKELYG